MSRHGVALPIAAIALVIAALTALLHADAAARVGAAADAGLTSTFALFGASAFVLLAGFAAWYLAPQRPDANLPELEARLAAALEREREFSGHLAHELRTPLTVLRTGLELAIRRAARAGEESRADLAELLATVDEMGRLTENLLMLARLDHGADRAVLEPVAVRGLVDGIWRRVATKAEARGLAFDNRLDEGAELRADRNKLQIVIQNLLRNAASYTERGGSIVVEATPTAVLTVWDSGPQLTEVHLARVFDRLWRADAARTDATAHAGLGLSLARGLCRTMGLELEVENVGTGGLRFSIIEAPRAGEVQPTGTTSHASAMRVIASSKNGP